MRPRVQRAPGPSLRPLLQEAQTKWKTSGEMPSRERGIMSQRHCEERSDEAILSRLASLDCFASLAMTDRDDLVARMSVAICGRRSPRMSLRSSGLRNFAATTYFPARLQVSPPQSMPTQPSTRSESGPADEIWLT